MHEHMFVHARYTYRLRISAHNQRLLRAEWDRCRYVWNLCVAESRAAGTERRRVDGLCSLSRLLTAERAGKKWLAEGSNVAQQQTTRAFYEAYSKAIKDRDDKNIPFRRRRGLPRLKSRKIASPSMEYTRRGFRLKGETLALAGGIRVRPVWSRELPSIPSSVRVFRDTLGHWYASFVVDRQVQPLPTTGWDLGIDWGIKKVATTTDPAFDLPHTDHGANAGRALARYQRQMARRRPARGHGASRGYKTARRAAAKMQSKVARQRTDEARKWAHTLVVAHNRIAVEDYRGAFTFANRRLARRAADARVSGARAALADAAVKYGRELIVVPAAYTTQDCSCCGARAKHRLQLSDRTYRRNTCGYVADRDFNAARNVAFRAGVNPAGADRVTQGELHVHPAA